MSNTDIIYENFKSIANNWVFIDLCLFSSKNVVQLMDEVNKKLDIYYQCINKLSPVLKSNKTISSYILHNLLRYNPPYVIDKLIDDACKTANIKGVLSRIIERTIDPGKSNVFNQLLENENNIKFDLDYLKTLIQKAICEKEDKDSILLFLSRCSSEVEISAYS